MIVIATRASASASELVINGLRPFVPVVIVGDRTYGKPVGQYLLPFCDKVLAPVSFSLVNANGEGDYFDGLPVDCTAADDISADLGFAGRSLPSGSTDLCAYGRLLGGQWARARRRRLARPARRAAPRGLAVARERLLTVSAPSLE